MLKLTRIIDLTSVPSTAGVPRLSLTFAERSKSRLVVQPAQGPAVAITLPRGSVLRDGTVLGGDGADVAIVEAAPEPLTCVTATNAHTLMRAVYHLANRHVAIQLGPNELLIERDPVLERMLISLGLHTEPVDAPFEPEAGAYSGHEHGHGHSHHDASDPSSVTIGEQLSIEAHRARPA